MDEEMAGFANESRDIDPTTMPDDAGRRLFLRQAAVATAFVWALPAVKRLESATALARMTPAPGSPPKKPDLEPPADKKPTITDKPPVDKAPRPSPEKPGKAPEVVQVTEAAAQPSEVPLPKAGVDTGILLGASTIALTGGVAALRTTPPRRTGTGHRRVPTRTGTAVCLERPASLLAAADRADWLAAVALAQHHRLDGRLFRALERYGVSDTAASATGTLRSAHEQQAGFAERYLFPQVESACTALLAAGITPTLLKGAALVAAGIVPTGARPTADIDVLVPRMQFPDAQAALERAGYNARVEARTRLRSVAHGYGDAPLHHSEHPMSLDLHWHLQGPHHRHPFDPEALQTCVLQLPSGLRIQRLTDPDLLAHLCLHFWQDRAKGLPGPLGQLWDVHDLVFG